MYKHTYCICISIFIRMLELVICMLDLWKCSPYILVVFVYVSFSQTVLSNGPFDPEHDLSINGWESTFFFFTGLAIIFPHGTY